jgi:hypothetical protein
MKIIVTGDRHLRYDVIFHALDHLRPTFLVFGDASGADEGARLWAAHHSVAFQRFVADWEAHDRAAGPLRNAAMLNAHRDAAFVLAFPRGGPGTKNCMAQAKRLGMLVLVCEALTP